MVHTFIGKVFLVIVYFIVYNKMGKKGCIDNSLAIMLLYSLDKEGAKMK